jgi:hypothetical protein
LGGILIVTFRNSIANFRLFSPPDPPDPHPAPHALLSVEATTPIKIFVSFRVFSWLKNGS